MAFNQYNFWYSLDWGIAYKNVMCMDAGKISDTKGAEPDITLSDCKQRCVKEESCKFMFFAIHVWTLSANRCALFQTCNYRTHYGDGDPAIYTRPLTSNNIFFTF